MTALPIDYDVVESAIRTWLGESMETGVASVVWTGGDVPQLPRPFAWCQWLGAPRETSPISEHDYPAVMMARVTVTSATQGQSYSLAVYEGVDALGTQQPETYSYTAQAGDDVDAIRDALLEQIEDAEWPNVRVDESDDRVGAMLLIGNVTGSRRRFTLTPSAGVSVNVLYHGHGILTRQDSEITFRVQVETDDGSANGNGRALLSRARSELNTRGRSDTLRDAGLVFRRSGAPLDVSFVANGGHVHRGSQDYIFAIRTEVDERRRFVRRFSTTVTVTGE